MRCEKCIDQYHVLFRILTSPLYFAKLKCDSKVPVCQQNEAGSVYYEYKKYNESIHIYIYIEEEMNRNNYSTTRIQEHIFYRLFTRLKL